MAHSLDPATRRQVAEAKRKLGQLPRKKAGCKGDPDCLREIREEMDELKAFIRRHEP